MQTQTFAANPMQMAHKRGAGGSVFVKSTHLPACRDSGHQHSKYTFMCEADLVVEGVDYELQA